MIGPVSVRVAAIVLTVSYPTFTNAQADRGSTPVIAGKIADRAFSLASDELKIHGARIVENGLVQQLLMTTVIGEAPLCDPNLSACRELTYRTIASDIKRITETLPQRSRQSLIALLDTTPPDQAKSMLTELWGSATPDQQQTASMHSSMLVSAGVQQVILEEERALRSKVAKATAHLPRRPLIVVPRPLKPKN